jgi:hypothetical protein
MEAHPLFRYAPFPPWWAPIVAVAIYATTLFSIQRYLRNREGFDLRIPLLIHNIILFLISLVLSIGIAYEAFMTLIYFGPFALYCGSGDDEWDARLLRWGIWFYLSKFYELFDTVFLALRKRPLTLLHVFHHVLVVTACWIQVRSEMYFGWITGLQNALIHVFMYYYFALQCVGQTVWWKRYLTQFQIIQFIVDCVTSFPWMAIYLSGAVCRGDPRAWLLANVGGVLLTLLFLNFYRNTYTSRKPQHTSIDKKKE